MTINVDSEVSPLKAVLLHRPGRELERLTPEHLENMLFEDIPWVEKMSREHDQFARILTEEGCSVYYLTELLGDVLSGDDHKPAAEARRALIENTLEHCGLRETLEAGPIEAYLSELDGRSLAEVIITGLEKHEISFAPARRPLSHYVREENPFYIPPLANLYFTRDPATVIGSTLSINAMKAGARRRESALIAFLVANHPLLRENREVLTYRGNPAHSIEGGDILVLNRRAVAVGCSARTSPAAIEQLASGLLQRGFEQVLAVQIPAARAYMHLDTVLTMVDQDAFSIFGGVEQELAVYRLHGTPELTVEPVDSLTEALEQALGLPEVRLIRNVDGDTLSAAREQWNDSTNTLAVAPGRVITYDRNVISNRELRRNGIEVLEIEGSELVRGRGGPRCMSMPLLRQ